MQVDEIERAGMRKGKSVERSVCRRRQQSHAKRGEGAHVDAAVWGIQGQEAHLKSRGLQGAHVIQDGIRAPRHDLSQERGYR